jgi:hypothetical protein
LLLLFLLLSALGEAAAWTSRRLRKTSALRRRLLSQSAKLHCTLTLLLLGCCFVVVYAHRRSRILDIKTLEEDPGAAQEFARSKAAARKEGLTGVEFKDIAGLDPILGEVLEVRLTGC